MPDVAVAGLLVGGLADVVVQAGQLEVVSEFLDHDRLAGEPTVVDVLGVEEVAERVPGQMKRK